MTQTSFKTILLRFCLFLRLKATATVCFLPSRVSRFTTVGKWAPKMVTGTCHTTPPDTFIARLVNWMVENRQKVFVYMDSALRAAYGVTDLTASHGGPFSYREYLHKLLKREFWGEEIVLSAVSMMWGLKIMVLNSKTLQEYRVPHNCAFKHVDVGLVYNSYSHYSAAGKSIGRSSLVYVVDGAVAWVIAMMVVTSWSIAVACYIIQYKMVVAWLVAMMVVTQPKHPGRLLYIVV